MSITLPKVVLAAPPFVLTALSTANGIICVAAGSYFVLGQSAPGGIHQLGRARIDQFTLGQQSVGAANCG